MIRSARVLVALLALGLAGCPGVAVSASCARSPDGTIECTIKAHKHEGDPK
jgi:hypothetical protein